MGKDKISEHRVRPRGKAISFGMPLSQHQHTWPPPEWERALPFFLLAIGLSAVVELGLGVSYGRTLAATPLQSELAKYYPESRAKTW